MFFGAFYLQMVRGYSPLETGLLFLPFAAAQLIFAPRSAAMVRKYGAKVVCAVGLLLVTVALSLFLFIGEGTPIWVLCMIFFIQGVGMANTIPPTTEAVMASLPRERAGVGSAVSNTIRQVGGALGVAVLGSLLSQVYRGQMAEHLTAFPEKIRNAASESIAASYSVATKIGPAGRALIEPANHAYVQAMHWAAGGAAIVALIGVIAILRWLPGHSATQRATSQKAQSEFADIN
jgi:Na+/melibiose symporter-like transporter